jgi:hypothetical protein
MTGESDPRETDFERGGPEEFPYEDREPEFDDTLGNGERGAAELVFESLEAFVTGYLLRMYRRAVSGNDATWCREWWRHPEAIARLDALWRAWEYLRLDPATGMSVWLRDHCDFHMRVLLSGDGPFKGCTPEKHGARPLQPLPSDPMPDGLAERLRAVSAGELVGEER